MLTSAESWMYGFSRNPEPDLDARKSLILSSIVGSGRAHLGSLMIVSGFLGKMVSGFPESLDDWTRSYLDGLGPDEQTRRSVLWFALSLSGLPRAKSLLSEIRSFGSQDHEERIAALMFTEVDVMALSVEEPWMVDLFWGLYWGSGDDRFIEKIAESLEWPLAPGSSSNRIAAGKHAFSGLIEHQKQNSSVSMALGHVFERRSDLAGHMSALDDAFHSYDPHTI